MCVMCVPADPVSAVSSEAEGGTRGNGWLAAFHFKGKAQGCSWHHDQTGGRFPAAPHHVTTKLLWKR